MIYIDIYSGTSALERPCIRTIRFSIKKLSWNFTSRLDFGTQLTAKHVINAYLSKNI